MRIGVLPALLLAARHSPCTRPQLCDNGDALRRAVDEGVNSVLGSAGADAASALERLQAERARRLESLGASTAPPPPPPRGPSRSAFSRSSDGDRAAAQAEAERRLRLLRQRQLGELEQPHAAEIERALRASAQWRDAGLLERAVAELDAVETFVSCRTETGAAFHLQLAAAAEHNGQARRALLLRRRVVAEARSSSQRWQAEQALERARAAGAAQSSPGVRSDGEASGELSNLFRMPDSWS